MSSPLVVPSQQSLAKTRIENLKKKMTEKYAKVIALLDKKVAEKTTQFFDIFNHQKTSK